jgi:hypothetical protein
MTGNFRVRLRPEAWGVLFSTHGLSEHHRELLQVLKDSQNRPTMLGKHHGKEVGLNDVLSQAQSRFRLVVGVGEGPRRYMHLENIVGGRGMPPRSVSKA